MTQLSYEPAFDPYNTAFRLFRIRDLTLKNDEIHIDRWRILDFYLLFPFLIGEIKLRTEDRAFRQLAKTYSHKKPYGLQPSSPLLFARMESIQVAAITTLARAGYIDASRLNLGQIKFTALEPTKNVRAKYAAKNETENSLMSILSAFANDYDLIGVGGLKERTGLMEHRYDAS